MRPNTSNSFLVTVVFNVWICGLSCAQDTSLRDLLVTTPPARHDSLYYEFFKKTIKTDTVLAKYYIQQVNILAGKYRHYPLFTRSWQGLAFFAQREGQLDSAIFFVREGIKYARLNGVKDRLVLMYNDIGNYFEQSDLYDSALSYYNKAYQVALDLNKPYDMAIAKNNIGLIFYHLLNFKGASENLAEAIRIKEENNITTGLAYNQVNLAMVKNDQGNYLEAIALLRKLESFCQASECDREIMVYFNYGMGYANYKTGRVDLAYPYFIAALQNAKGVAGVEQTLCYTYQAFADISFRNGNLSEATEFLNQAERIALDFKFRRNLRDIYELFSIIYDANGNYPLALRYKDRFISLKDSIFNEQLSENLKNIQLDVQKQESDRIIARMDSQLNRTRTITALASIIALLSGILLFFIVRSLRLSKNIEKRLAAEVQSRTADLQKSYLDIQRSYGEYDHLVYRISHDLQGPISTIEGLANIGILDIERPGASIDYFKKIQVATKGLTKTLRKLSEVNAIRNSYLVPEDIDIQLLGERCIQKMKELPVFPLVQINYSMGPWHKGIKSDVHMIEFALENLFANAFQFININRTDGQQPFIHLRWSQDLNYTTIIVEDNGHGVAEGLRDRVFQLFVVPNVQQGSGAGLFLSQMAVTRLGGRIFLDSPKNPTSFRMVIPNDLAHHVGTFSTPLMTLSKQVSNTSKPAEDHKTA